MKENLIECYHQLLEHEREKLRKENDKFTPQSRLQLEEVTDLCKRFGLTIGDLEKEKLLIKYPDGTFRTLHYDMIFRLLNLRPYEFGSKLPLEFKIIQYPERFFDFEEKNIEEINIPKEVKIALFKSGINTISNYQFEYIQNILSGRHKGYIISAPTASGKTLIFTIPLLVNALKGERTILIYPRRALASDQLLSLLQYLTHLNQQLKKNKKRIITIGIDDGDTPTDSKYAKGDFRGLSCPLCKKNNTTEKLFYARDGDRVFIKCGKGHVFDFIKSTKSQIWNDPPQILISNGWIINRRLMEPQAQKLFKEKIKYIVLDEAHVYREEIGAHIHFVLKRLKRKLIENTKEEPIIILSSATLPEETVKDFSSSILGMNERKVFLKNYRNFLSRKKQRMVIHLILLPNPFTSAEVLAENVLLFLTEWSTLQKRKSLFFVDSTHEIHRLYHFVNDVIIKTMRFRALEHLKSSYSVEDPYYWGHYANKKVCEKDEYLINEFSKNLDYHYGGLNPKRRYEIEDAFKKGLKRCLLATSTLELGIDIGDLSVIAQYKYPMSNESYIQRVGRAGRSEDSYYVTLSILILNNSPSQLRFIYGEETRSLFELPPDYQIPLSIQNEFIREHHEFFEVLDSLAGSGRSTFIQTSNIRDFWRGKSYKEVIKDVKQLLRDGISVRPDKKYLLQYYLKTIQNREDIIALTETGEEIPFPIKFKSEKLDPLQDLEEWLSNNTKQLTKIFGDALPPKIKEFFMNTLGKLTSINQKIEHAHTHFKEGNRESFEIVCREIEIETNALKNFLLNNIEKLEENLLEFRRKLMEDKAPDSQRTLLRKIDGELSERLSKDKIENIEITYKELLGYFSNIILEIESSLKDPRRYWQFDLIKALNILGTTSHLSLLFEKPLPKIYVNYLGLPKQSEYMERTVDQLLWLCTPFRVIPMQEKYYFTVVYGLPEWKYKIRGYPDYNALEGGDVFSFSYLGKRYTAITPHFINMINLNDNVVEAISNSVYGSQNSKLIISNTKKGYLPHDIESCRFCFHGFIITSQQREVCSRTFKDCTLFPQCQGKKWFRGPKPPYYRTPYLSLVKVYSQIYSNATPFKPTIMEITVGKNIVLKLGKGSLFDRALIGCYLISGGSQMNFIYPPTFNLTHNTLGYRISSNGICVEFDKKYLKSILKTLLMNSKIYSWVVIKYLITKKYFKERGDLKLDFCQRAFEGLVDEESATATKQFKKEFLKWLRKKEIEEELLEYAVFMFLHSLSHLFYEYILDKLQTNADNLAYHIDTKNYKIYLIENAEKGLGLTETLAYMIRKEHGKEFFIQFLQWCLQIIEDCDYHKKKIKESARRELKEKISRLTSKEKDTFDKINSLVKKMNEYLQETYNIEFPVEILRGILVKKFGNNPAIMEAIISNVSHCWDGCYNCVRLERNCNYDPYKQMTRVSKILLKESIYQILNDLGVPIEIGRGNFGWVLNEIDKTKKELRICSPWISGWIIKKHIEPLLEKGISVKIITRIDFENEEQIKTVRYLNDLCRRYKNLKIKYIDKIHAKIYIIDNKIGIKGSFNLTKSGLFDNIETGEKYTDKEIVEKQIEEFDNIFEID